MKGPASRLALDPAVLVAYVDSHTTKPVGGVPRRVRLTINGRVVSENDARIIRRWRSGQINGVTKAAAARLLSNYRLGLSALSGWADENSLTYVLRGQLTLPHAS